MAAKGSAAKSASGAAMSKYDVEVEARLKKLEAEVRALQTHEHTTDASAPAGDKTEILWKIVSMMEPNFDALVKKVGG